MSLVLGVSFLPLLPTSPPLQRVRELPEFAYLMSLHRSSWLRCLLWHGWLPGLNGISHKDPWATSFGDLASFYLERCLGALLVLGLLLSIGMLLILPWRCPSILMSGLMVLVSSYLLLNLLLKVRFGERVRSMVMFAWSVVVLFCQFPVFCRLFSVLNSGVLFLLCRRTGLVI